MKRTIMTIILAVLGVAASAVERVYVSTDKDVYVAGDIVWCSAFCIDSSTGCLSDASSVAYVELSSSRMTSATCKIALIGGRGSGFLQIPFTTPTGNYSILGFTYSGKERPDIELDAKVVSVFNTLSSERVKGNVRIVDAPEYDSLKPVGKQTSGEFAILAGRTVDCNSEGSLYLENKSGESVSLSLSVCLDDGILSPSGASIIDFLGLSISDYPSSQPESDGEVLRGRLVGSDATQVADNINQLAFVAFPGARNRNASRAAPCKSTYLLSSMPLRRATSRKPLASSTRTPPCPPCADVSARKRRSAKANASSAARATRWPSANWSASWATGHVRTISTL